MENMNTLDESIFNDVETELTESIKSYIDIVNRVVMAECTIFAGEIIAANSISNVPKNVTHVKIMDVQPCINHFSSKVYPLFECRAVNSIGEFVSYNSSIYNLTQEELVHSSFSLSESAANEVKHVENKYIIAYDKYKKVAKNLLIEYQQFNVGDIVKTSDDEFFIIHTPVYHIQENTLRWRWIYKPFMEYWCVKVNRRTLKPTKSKYGKSKLRDRDLILVKSASENEKGLK